MCHEVRRKVDIWQYGTTQQHSKTSRNKKKEARSRNRSRLWLGDLVVVAVWLTVDFPSQDIPGPSSRSWLYGRLRRLVRHHLKVCLSSRLKC